MILPEPKYRPVLTASQIQWILSAAKSESPHMSGEAISIIVSLAPFAAKIENAGLKPSYVARVTESVEQKLGFAPLREIASPEAKRLAAYNKWAANRSACSLTELELAHTYRYENGLMTDEEMRTFENEGAIGIDDRRTAGAADKGV